MSEYVQDQFLDKRPRHRTRATGDSSVRRRTAAQLRVGSADSAEEISADRTAESVVAGLRASAAVPRPVLSRSVDEREAGRMGAAGGIAGSALRQDIDEARGGGRPLPLGVRRSMEEAFDTDFSSVRVHTGSKSERLNRQMSAQAFTLGHDVFFRDGLPPTPSSSGTHLLAHELAHVVQSRAPAQVARSYDLLVQRKPKVGDLVGKGFLGRGKSKAHKAMLKGPTTCYEAAVYSLVVTGELELDAFQGWAFTIPKADTHDVIDPGKDKRVVDPKRLPKHHLVGFYRRTRSDETPALESESSTGWVLFHMVRTTSKPGSMVLGANNGDRDGTKPRWSINDVAKMFDWGGTEQTSMAPASELPEKGSFGKKDKDGTARQQFVAFAVPIGEAVKRLNAKYSPA